MKHTPGPWKVKDGKTKLFGVRHISADGVVLADVWKSTDSTGANARLIAAAPDLLEALQAIARGLTNGQKERGDTPQSIARALLARLGEK